MIRIDLENIIRDSKLYQLAKKNCTYEEANQQVGELCNEIGMLYFEQDGVEFEDEQ